MRHAPTAHILWQFSVFSYQSSVISRQFSGVDTGGNIYTAEVDTGKRIQKCIRYGEAGCRGTGRSTVGGVLQ
jgi:hypothetical protein